LPSLSEIHYSGNTSTSVLKEKNDMFYYDSMQGSFYMLDRSLFIELCDEI